MKKIIYIMLLALVLTGCGNAEKESNNKTVKEENSMEQVEKEEAEETETTEDTTQSEETIQTETSSDMDNTNTTIEKTTMYAKSNVNVRSGAGTSNAQIGSLTKGQEVTKVGEENGWSKIEFNGTVGYVNSKYLSTEQVEAGNSNTGNKTNNNTTSNPNNSDSTNIGNNNTTTNQNTVPSAPVHEHTWEEITEEKKVYYAWRTLCGKCGLDMTDLTDDELTWHTAAECHSGYSTHYIAVDFVTTDYKIIVTNVGYKCSCGATKEGTGASWIVDEHVTIYTQGSN